MVPETLLNLAPTESSNSLITTRPNIFLELTNVSWMALKDSLEDSYSLSSQQPTIAVDIRTQVPC